LKSQYDVIIIGSGPAGLACAEQIMGSELSVLVIDKKKRLGQKFVREDLPA